MDSTGFYEAGAHRRVRLRETYVRDVVAPLLGRGAGGAVKVDLLLRALAWNSSDEPGLVSPDLTWERLHDWCRPPADFGQTDRILKRKWVSDKLDQLERVGTLRRERGSGRPKIVVLSDARNGAALDDPAAALSLGIPDDQHLAPAASSAAASHPNDTYVSVLCDGFEYGRFTRWEGPQFAAYFAAMIGERYARNDPLMRPLLAERPAGAGIWFRKLNWFADVENLRPDHHIRIPFSERTLSRGFALLRDEGLVSTVRSATDPRTGHPFRTKYGRQIYFNGFHDLRVRRRQALQSPRAMHAVLARPHASDDAAILALLSKS
ncbi:hypothetical protein [Nocardioides immobilis]|uniref:hypothetical protein n=1 Tax=Nocardioides immobilis TaxID=2049295 RepID=UPI0011C369D5|nr:hypothetical protein [Nocardioides immobilis]